MGKPNAEGPAATARAGLCTACRHAQPLRGARGSVFWRCAASGLPRYPRLPVVCCPAREPSDPEADPLGDTHGER